MIEKEPARLEQQLRPIIEPIENDINCIARIIRKYGIEREKYVPDLSLQELVGPDVTIEQREAQRFSEARDRIMRATRNSSVSLLLRIGIDSALHAVYFSNEDELTRAG